MIPSEDDIVAALHRGTQVAGNEHLPFVPSDRGLYPPTLVPDKPPGLPFLPPPGGMNPGPPPPLPKGGALAVPPPPFKMAGDVPPLRPGGFGPTPPHIWDQLREFDRGRNAPGGYSVTQTGPKSIEILDDNKNLLRTLKW